MGKTFLVLLVALSLMAFQNCARAKFSPDAESLASKSDAPGSMTDPTVAPPEEGDPRKAYSGACAAFKDQTLPLQITPANNDIQLSQSVGVMKTIPLADEVTIQNVIGAVEVTEARSVSVQGIVGKLRILKADVIPQITSAVVGVQASANRIESVRDLVGLTCLHAGEIGDIQDVVSGTKIVASKIGKISNFVGVVRVYGAEIQEVGNFVGFICLYDGAKVLNRANFIGTIRNCQ